MVPKNTELFVYFPTVYSRSVNMTANGKSVGKWGDNNTWRIVSIGESNKSDLDLKLTIKNDYDNFYIKQNLTKPFIYSLDMEVFTEAITRLQQGNLQLDHDNYREDYLPGTITTKNENQLITTTIPYDKGWQVTVDGKKVETVELANALVGYYIEEPGEHEIEMRYCPKELVLGVAISVISTIAFFLLIIFEKKLRRIRGYGEFFGIPEPVAANEDNEQTAIEAAANQPDAGQTPEQ
jgi:uncharacterized membrane protein YfhO